MFGEKLRKLRAEAGLTQDQLADRLFVTRAAVSKWETDRGYPNIDSLKQISALFGVTIDQLIADEDVENHQQLEKRRSRKFYWYAMACLAVTLLATLGRVFLKLPYMNVVGVLGMAGYVAFAFCSKPKDKKLALRQYIVPYVLSRVVVLLIVIAVAVSLLVAME